MQGLRTALLAIGTTLLVALPAWAEVYLLGAGDVLRIDVLDQDELSLEQTRVQASGTVALPQIGPIEVTGLTPNEARDEIRNRLRLDLGLVNPEVLVEVVAYRPVFVTGDVNSPGAYEYQPGMTVIQAVALAGSFVRPQRGDMGFRIEKGSQRFP